MNRSAPHPACAAVETRENQGQQRTVERRQLVRMGVGCLAGILLGCDDDEQSEAPLDATVSPDSGLLDASTSMDASGLAPLSDAAPLDVALDASGAIRANDIDLLNGLLRELHTARADLALALEQLATIRFNSLPQGVTYEQAEARRKDVLTLFGEMRAMHALQVADLQEAGARARRNSTLRGNVRRELRGRARTR